MGQIRQEARCLVQGEIAVNAYETSFPRERP